MRADFQAELERHLDAVRIDGELTGEPAEGARARALSMLARASNRRPWRARPALSLPSTVWVMPTQDPGRWTKRPK